MCKICIPKKEQRKVVKITEDNFEELANNYGKDYDIWHKEKEFHHFHDYGHDSVGVGDYLLIDRHNDVIFCEAWDLSEKYILFEI